MDVEENKMQEHESTSSHRNILDTLFEGDDGEFAVENNQRIPIIRCEICDEDIEDNKVSEHELKALSTKYHLKMGMNYRKIMKMLDKLLLSVARYAILMLKEIKWPNIKEKLLTRH